VGGFIALALVELLLLIYVFAKLLSFRAHKKQQNLLPLQRLDFTLAVPSSILMFRVLSRLLTPWHYSFLLDLSLSLLWFLLELGAFQFVELVIVLQQLPIRTTTELPSMI
jgi:hypothetical protein